MAKSREHIVTNGKAAFYACIWDDLRNAAMDYGWALALHGSLKNDMDIMAMPWTQEAKPVEEMIQALSNCFTESPYKNRHTIAHIGKPHGRIVYTMSIWADFYLDISIMPPCSSVLVSGQSELLLNEFTSWQKRYKDSGVDITSVKKFIEMEGKQFL